MKKAASSKPYSKFTSYLFLWVFSLFVAVTFTCTVITYFLPRKLAMRYPIIAASLNQFVCNLFGLTHQVEGQAPSGAVIVASLHQSIWETSSLNSIIPSCAYVLKREILFYPFVGPFLWYIGMIYVDRKKGSKALRHMVKESKRVLQDEKRPLIIFPEGTRTAPGARADLHGGVYLIYKENQVPVVPLLLDSGIYWPRHKPPIKSGVIHLRFGKQIPPNLDRKEFSKRLEAALHDGMDDMLQEYHPQTLKKVQKARKQKAQEAQKAQAGK